MRSSLMAFLCAGLVVAACKRDSAPAQPPLQPTAPASAPRGTPLTDDHAVVASGHPRIWITAADLPRLRGWANAKNPVWKDGLAKAVEQALTIYDTEFYPGGQPNPNWPDSGIDNWVRRSTEAYAELFAFMSLVDPDESARPAHVTRAKNLLMYVIREAAKGASPDPAKPERFRGAKFATYNRASAWGEGFALTVDWIYSALNAEEKTVIRKVFMRWADENVHAVTAGDEHPEPIGVINEPRILADKSRLRWTIDNYFTAHMRQLAFYGLAFDAADDPPLDPAAPPGRLGNTARSYLDNAVGAWLYYQYAVYEDPTIASAAIGVPASALGLASGGLSPEGFLYGSSIGMLHEALLALYTAGYRDTRKYGPQIGLIGSGYWDRVVDGVLHSLVAEPQPVPGEAYIGPVYQFASYGDTQRYWLMPDYATMFLSLAIHDRATGNAKRLDKDRWLVVNAMEGIAAGLSRRIANMGGNSTASLSILHFLALDPAAKPTEDPRPSLPLTFVDRQLGRVIARTAWGPNGTMFDYKCSWETISHQHGDCNQFEMWRKGEWLVKERTGYANDPAVLTSEFHNTLAIQNKTTSGADKPADLQWFEVETWARGGQFTVAQNAGDPKVLTSSAPAWSYAQGDATNLYNRPSRHGDGATDVAHASRSIAWVKPDFIVVYDRATTKSDNRFKRFFLVSGGDADVQGKLATFTTPKGQKLYVQTLLPANATSRAVKAEPFNQMAAGEPSRSKLMVEDPASPRDIRFLHVLQGADAGVAPAAVIAVQSSAGTPFAGAVVGAYAVVFPVDPNAPFTKVTYAVPASVTSQLVCGLRPGVGYDVALTNVGGNVEVTVTAGSAYKADDAGVIAFGGFAPKKP